MSNLEIFFSEIHKSKKSLKTTPKKILEKCGVGRRGWRVIGKVNDLLVKYELTASPDFRSAYIGGIIEIAPIPKLGAKQSKEKLHSDDPIPKLSILKAANINNIKDEPGVGLISVNRDTPLIEAITLMIKHNFSQLPILSGKKEVDGIISWRSIGIALSLEKECIKVIDCKEDVTSLSLNEPLFKAVKVILEKEVVLVYEKDKTICGIVTATDIGEHFISLSEPYLLLEQIENHIRKILADKLIPKDVTGLLDLEKELTDLSELTFGQYVRIIENPKIFDKLKIKVDRVILTKMLNETCTIRNEVMHFNPDPVQDFDIETLRQTLNFLNVIATAS